LSPLISGEDFERAALPLVILLPGTVGFAVAKPIYAVGQAKGDVRTLIIATLPPAIINIILNVTLIPRLE
jgi:O-antigen/teichoic acid export membrane protein